MDHPTPEHSAESVASEIVQQDDVMCASCGSDAWVSHAFDLSRALCLDCGHEWSRDTPGGSERMA